MPRATIPYDKIQNRLDELYPSPTFRYVRFRRPSRQNNVKAPQTIYARIDGKFTAIGYKVSVSFDRFTKLSNDLERGIFVGERETILVEI